MSASYVRFFAHSTLGAKRTGHGFSAALLLPKLWDSTRPLLMVASEGPGRAGVVRRALHGIHGSDRTHEHTGEFKEP
jgi:hypothetical protein